MVNADTGCIVDMLESRESADVSAWLATFPNIETVSRDGSAMYANAIRTAHPGAIQISDRFHIIKGLTDAARQYALSIVGQRIAIPADNAPSSYWLKQQRNETDLPERLHNATTKKRTVSVLEVRELYAQGFNLRQISELTGHGYNTVKKYIDPEFDPEFKEYGVSYPSKLKPYCDAIDGMLDARNTFREIEAEIRKMGYCGAASTIRMYATRKRRHNQAAMAEHRQNTEIVERRHLLKLLYIPIERVKGISQEQLDKVIALFPQLNEIYSLISDFKFIVSSHHVDGLEPWLATAKALNSPDIDSFVNGITRDIVAVKNAITSNFSNGLAEGSINKIKRIKHTMYGRASFSILRTKTLMYESWRLIN